MSTEVNLCDFINGNCPYKGCAYNHVGECITDDDEKMSDILQMVISCNMRNIPHSSKSFTCFNVKHRKSICIECGCKLVKNEFNQLHCPEGC